MLLLRLVVFVFLVERCWAADWRFHDDTSLLLVATTAGLLVLIGLWTPIAAGVLTLLELWIAFTTVDARAAHLLVATIAAGLTVLGPGAWSIDARLFGRRRIAVAERETRKRR